MYSGRYPNFEEHCSKREVTDHKCWKEELKVFFNTVCGFKRIENIPYDPKKSSSSFDYLFKTLLIGDSSVGKTSLLRRFADNEFNTQYWATIGIDFKIVTAKDYMSGGKVVKVQLWDTAGQERFRTITSSYYRGAHGVLVCFDLTRKSTFEHAFNWFDEIKRYSGDVNSVKSSVLVGCKCDLKDKREVSMGDIERFTKQNEIPYFETSSKDGIGVEEAFFSCARSIHTNHMKPKEKEETKCSEKEIETQKDNGWRCSIM